MLQGYSSLYLASCQLLLRILRPAPDIFLLIMARPLGAAYNGNENMLICRAQPCDLNTEKSNAVFVFSGALFGVYTRLPTMVLI